MDSMNSQSIMSCYNCGFLIKQNGKPCDGCGAINVQVLTEGSSSSKGTHYVFQTTDHGETINEDDDFTFPEVEITPPSLEDLIQTYLTTLEQLKSEGCLFYSLLHNPKSGNNEVSYVGLPEDVVESVNAVVKVHFPLKKKRRAKAMSKEDLFERKYCCPDSGCDYRTKYSWQVKNHMRQHTGEKPYACNRCNFRTADSSRLLKHNRAHDLVTSQRCKICGLGFTKARGLICHMRLSHGVTEYEVEQPDVHCPYPKVRLLQASKVKSDHVWKCEVCGLVSQSRVSHVVHCRVHTGERPYPCDKCAYRARQKESLKFHMKSHADMDSKAMGCEKCNFRTDHYAALVRHCKLFHSSQEANAENEGQNATSEKKMTARKVTRVGPWKCAKCDFEASTRLKLETHRKEAHPKLPASKYMMLVDGDTVRYRCKKCNFLCNEEVEILNHSKMHITRLHECDLCDFKLPSRTVLSRHKVAIHNISHPNQCTSCDFKSVTYRELVQHRKSAHVALSNFNCRQCSFTTHDRAMMKIHEESHKESSVAFICLKCSYTCYSKFESKVHQSTHITPAGGKVKPGKRYRQRRHSLSSTNKPANSTTLAGKYSQLATRLLLHVTPNKANIPTVGESVASLLKTLDGKSSLDSPQPDSESDSNQPILVKSAMPKLMNLLKLQETPSTKPVATTVAAVNNSSQMDTATPEPSVAATKSTPSLVSIVKPRSGTIGSIVKQATGTNERMISLLKFTSPTTGDQSERPS